MRSVLKCSIYSAKNVEGVLGAMDMTDEVCRELKLTEKERFHLRLITEEACTNAYEYCLYKRYDYYFVYWEFECNYLMLTFSHPGEGFSLPSPFFQPKLEERGRGLVLIQSLADVMRIEKQGDYIFFRVGKRLHTGHVRKGKSHENGVGRQC